MNTVVGITLGTHCIMTITKESVQHVAKLARLELTDAELARYTDDLSKILDLVAELNELDLDNVDMTLTAEQLAKTPVVYRPNGSELPFDREQVFKNAPHEEDGCFRVPKILDTSKKNTEVTHA